MKKFSIASVFVMLSLFCFSQTTFTGVKDIPLPVAMPISDVSVKAFQPNSLIGCYATSEARTAARNAWLAEKSIIIITSEENWTNSNPNNNNQFCIHISGNNTMGTPLEPLNIEPDARILPVPTCKKTLYGPTIWTEYGTEQEARNGATSWLSTKTDVITQSIEPYSVQGTDPGQVSWAVEITYVRAGSCYK